MRVIYNNLLDTATLTSDSIIISTFPLSNITNTNKGKVWRVSGNTANIKMSWGIDQIVSCIAIPYSNLTSLMTLRVRLYSDTAFTTLLIDSGAVNVTNARTYLTTRSDVKSLQVDITDTSLGYIQLGTIVLGDYWTPTYGTEFGVETSVISSSTLGRTHSGNLINNIGTISRVLNIPLNWLTESDKVTLLKLLKINKTVFISVFPEDTSTKKEGEYQLYGKLVSSATISNKLYNMYTSSLQLEEL